MTKEETLDAWRYLEEAASTKKAKEMLAFAKDKLMSLSVETGAGKRSAVDYARQLFCISFGFYGDGSDSLLVASIGVALTEAEKSQSAWNYGSEVFYDLRAAGIPLTMEEAVAIAAAPVNWSDPNKWGLLHNHKLAAAIYCANVVVWHYAYRAGASVEYRIDFSNPNGEIERAVKATIPYIGDERKVRKFWTALVNSDFFSVNDGELVHTTLRTVETILTVSSPKNEAELGKVILAALCSNLWQISWGKDHALSRDDSGNVLWDPYPLGPGRKSSFLAGSFFGKELGKDVAEALDAFMADNVSNPNVCYQFANNRLTIWLHLAWVMTSNEQPFAVDLAMANNDAKETPNQ